MEERTLCREQWMHNRGCNPVTLVYRFRPPTSPPSSPSIAASRSQTPEVTPISHPLPRPAARLASLPHNLCVWLLLHLHLQKACDCRITLRDLILHNSSMHLTPRQLRALRLLLHIRPAAMPLLPLPTRSLKLHQSARCCMTTLNFLTIQRRRR